MDGFGSTCKRAIIKVEEGFHIIEPKVQYPLKAAYGLYLIQLCKDADEKGEKMGKFIEITPLTLEEFKAKRKVTNRRKLFKHHE